jgi:hypothetical protein
MRVEEQLYLGWAAQARVTVVRCSLPARAAEPGSDAPITPFTDRPLAACDLAVRS